MLILELYSFTKLSLVGFGLMHFVTGDGWRSNLTVNGGVSDKTFGNQSIVGYLH